MIVLNLQDAAIWEYYLSQTLKIDQSKWVRVFDSVMKKLSRQGWSESDYKTKTKALVLIHPDYYPESLIESGVDPRGARTFGLSPTLSAKCRSDIYFGYSCPLPITEGYGLTMDHIWPYSLGGPTKPDNGIWLCSFHNGCKGSDYHLLAAYHLDRFVWVESILKKIRGYFS